MNLNASPYPAISLHFAAVYSSITTSLTISTGAPCSLRSPNLAFLVVQPFASHLRCVIGGCQPCFRLFRASLRRKSLLSNMVLAKPKRKKTQDPTSGESDSSKPRPNGVKSALNMATASKEKALKKSLKKHPSKDDASSKKQKRKGDKGATSPPAITKKRKNKPELSVASDDSSDGENRRYSQPGECSQLPSVSFPLLPCE